MPPLPVSRINHITLVVKSIERSIKFYEDVLGFTEIRRPESFEEAHAPAGAWLWREGMSIHLILGEPLKRSPSINVCSDHLSFQPTGTVEEVETCLQSHGIKYLRQFVNEGNLIVPQIFFHDPDDNMLEICPCDCLPVLPVAKICGLEDPSPAASDLSMASGSDLAASCSHFMNNAANFL